MGYDNRIRTKYTAKWGVQIAGMIFQTRSKVTGGCISGMNFGYVTENGVNSNNRRTAFYKLIFISLYNKIIADI